MTQVMIRNALWHQAIVWANVDLISDISRHSSENNFTVRAHSAIL